VSELNTDCACVCLLSAGSPVYACDHRHLPCLKDWTTYEMVLELEASNWKWAPWPGNVRPGEVLWEIGDAAATWYGAAHQRKPYLELLIRASHEPEACKARGLRRIDLCRGGAAGTSYYRIMLEILDRDPTKVPGVDDDDGDLSLQHGAGALPEPSLGSDDDGPIFDVDVDLGSGAESADDGVQTPGRDESEDEAAVMDVDGLRPAVDGGTRTPGRDESEDEAAVMADDGLRPAVDGGTRTPGRDESEDEAAVVHADRVRPGVARLPAGEASLTAASRTSLDRKEGASTRFSWGAFTFEMKSGREWFAECPYHRLHRSYGCRKYLTIDAGDGCEGENLVQAHMDVINRLKFWCLLCQTCTRQRYHVPQTPALTDVPAAPLLDDQLLAENLMHKPERHTVRTDEELDEEDLRAGLIVELPTRKRGRKRAAEPKAKPKRRRAEADLAECLEPGEADEDDDRALVDELHEECPGESGESAGDDHDGSDPCTSVDSSDSSTTEDEDDSTDDSDESGSDVTQGAFGMPPQVLSILPGHVFTWVFINMNDCLLGLRGSLPRPFTATAVPLKDFNGSLQKIWVVFCEYVHVLNLPGEAEASCLCRTCFGCSAVRRTYI